MRKIKILFLSFIAMLCAIFGIACGEVKPNGSNPLQINDPNGYVLEDISGYYAFDTDITLKIAFTSGIEVKPYLNGVELTNGELVEKHGTYYYQFTFKMPPRPSIIQIFPSYDPEEDVDPLPPIAGMNNVIFTVGYDYGNYQQTAAGASVATLLLDGCLPFFDFNEYNLPTPILAGDELTVYYTGEMYEEESYPGKVVIKNGRVEWVEKSNDVRLREVTCIDGEISGKEYFAELPYYVINIDGTCTPLSVIPSGTRLYAAYVEEYVPGSLPTPGEEGECVQPDIMEVVTRLTGLYSYNPDYTISIQELLPWTNEITIANVGKISVRRSNPSVGPNALVTMEETTNTTDIRHFMDAMKSLSFRRISQAEGQVDGGSLVEFTVTTKDGEQYQYTTYAGNYYAGGIYYRPSAHPPVFANGKTYYQFPDLLSSADLYVNGNFEQRYENVLTGITFQRVEEIGSWEEPAQKLVLDNGSRQLIYVLTPKRFYIEDGSGNCYEIVGEKDFQKIFDDYITGEGELILPTGQYTLTVVGAKNVLYKNPQESYTPFERVTIYADVLTDVDVVLYLNGKSLGSGQDGEVDGRYLWEYTFVMPAKNSILYVNLEGGMLPAVEDIDFVATYIVSSYIENEKGVCQLSTVEDMQAYLQGVNGGYGAETATREICKKYDEEYFARKDLIIVIVNAPSSSVSYEVKSLTVYHGQERKTCITVQEISPDGEGDCAVSGWQICIEIDKYAAIQERNLTLELI